ncbi:hypothetical protein AAG570_003775, partial [Ranatra chinensis]
EDFESWGVGSNFSEYYVGKDKILEIKTKLTDKKVPFEIMIDDLQRAIDVENPPLTDEEIDELVGRKGHRLTWQAYHRLDDIHGYLDYLAQTYPNLVTLGNLGSSVEGRPLKYVKISSGESNAKAFWIDGGIHAREWISPSVVSYIASEFVENRDEHLADIKGIDFYILPVMNPDGYEYTHQRDRLWRGYKWGGKGSSKQQCKEIYGGSGPFSEPETASVSRFISSIQNTKYILYPYGYDVNQPAPNEKELQQVGLKAAQAIRATTGADDWAKGAANIQYTYTIELRDRGQYGFILPAQYILPTAKESLAAIKAIASEISSAP